MKLVFKNGTELEIEQAVECYSPRNSDDTFIKNIDDTVLEISIPLSCSMSLTELANLFTPDECEELNVITDYGSTTFSGYTKMINVSNITGPTMFSKRVLLGHAQ